MMQTLIVKFYTPLIDADGFCFHFWWSRTTNHKLNDEKKSQKMFALNKERKIKTNSILQWIRRFWLCWWLKRNLKSWTPLNCSWNVYDSQAPLLSETFRSVVLIVERLLSEKWKPWKSHKSSQNHACNFVWIPRVFSNEANRLQLSQRLELNLLNWSVSSKRTKIAYKAFQSSFLFWSVGHPFSRWPNIPLVSWPIELRSFCSCPKK